MFDLKIIYLFFESLQIKLNIWIVYCALIIFLSIIAH